MPPARKSRQMFGYPRAMTCCNSLQSVATSSDRELVNCYAGVRSMRGRGNWAVSMLVGVGYMAVAVLAPEWVFAQAASPFETGATNLVTSLTTLATPVAVLLV